MKTHIRGRGEISFSHADASLPLFSFVMPLSEEDEIAPGVPYYIAEPDFGMNLNTGHPFLNFLEMSSKKHKQNSLSHASPL